MAVNNPRDKAVAFLNAHFSPWTFDGDEPVSVALTALLCDVADDALKKASDKEVSEEVMLRSERFRVRHLTSRA